ncbi:MAG: ABC transporter ATP-binding protein [Sphaerochaetaceae bacterium]|jgi:ABC-type Mn2+/Zn2+ transport system ATPase subunit|nr:ABC transporter ATP-binding protein [Sphaerochaetaceae bacterium]MDD2405174.1 ABC transporter ATP-binding protein [Sphaerochaetaceae bacterium]MDD3669876.1 ABC transporter ATP-binding protein [Sphaerochaetaceae bacterium]MDD4259332.1 ABC transporter ATP-binding protein [Sphaerochaetaceae bacterium]MDD4842226.1 ABC transporter ATP-binding protein [Sphaerochaetaceae bacterium]
MSSIITLDQVEAGYGKDPVIHNVSFSVESGTFVVIIGPNGGGKSTLLKLLCGALSPTSGTVTVLNTPLNCEAAKRCVRIQIGYLSQIQQDPKIAISVLESVLIGRWGSSFSWLHRCKKEDYQAAWDTLELIGAQHLATKDIRTLSGGQRQRIALARALVRKPPLLLMDEPTTYLDPESKDEFIQLIRSLHKELHITMITVTHEHMPLMKHDRLLKIEDGHIFELNGEMA